MIQNVRIAAVQAEPAWLDLQGGVDKTISLIKQAAEAGINILGFPEVWIPGYPCAIWSESPMGNSKMLLTYRQNSLGRDSPEMRRIQTAVKEAGIFVVLGYSERDGNSCYIAQSFLSPEGQIVNHRRKIKPTGAEKYVWGEGGAESLTTVVKTSFGRVGALAYAENMNPLLRYCSYTQVLQIHVAMWPMTFDWHRLEKPVPGHENFDGDLLACQHMAREGGCFVMAPTQLLKLENFEKCNIKAAREAVETATHGGGHSMIYGPTGKPLVQPLAEDEEGILHADIDLADLEARAQMTDIVGQSARPDLLSLLVNDKVATVVTKMSN